MYYITHSKDSKGFLYVDLLVTAYEVGQSITGTVHNFVSEITQVDAIENHRQAVKCLLRLLKIYKQHNCSLDPNFLPRSKRVK